MFGVLDVRPSQKVLNMVFKSKKLQIYSCVSKGLRQVQNFSKIQGTATGTRFDKFSNNVDMIINYKTT